MLIGGISNKILSDCKIQIYGFVISDRSSRCSKLIKGFDLYVNKMISSISYVNFINSLQKMASIQLSLEYSVLTHI